MVDKIIIDADLCIKLGGSNKYTYLYDVLPLISKKIYAYTCTLNSTLAIGTFILRSEGLLL